MSGPLPLGSYVIAYTWGCIPRAYSIATTDSSSFTLLVSFSGGGAGSRFFRDTPKGSGVIFYGPFDDFPYHAGTGRPKIFFATSTGVAPFRMMVEETIKEKVPAILLLGSPKESDLAFKRDFENLSQTHPSFIFFPVLSNPDPEWSGATGYITDYIGNHPDLVRQSDIYICGVPPMTFGVLGALKSIGMSKDQIFVQKFG
jgi:NAD(P)H-flavin reductase